MNPTVRTVASILKSARESRGQSFEQIYRDLKIHPRFLKALEEGAYEVFSSSVHLKGFLKNYAEYLGLGVAEVLAFWRREYNEAEAKRKGKSFLLPLSRPFSLTPGWVLTGFTFLLTAGFFLYLLWAYRSLAAPPYLRLEQPAEDLRTKVSSLTVAGKVDPEATLTLNGQKVSLGEGGRFRVMVDLSAGVNVLDLAALGRSGRENKIRRTIVLESTSSAY